MWIVEGADGELCEVGDLDAGATDRLSVGPAGELWFHQADEGVSVVFAPGQWVCATNGIFEEIS